MILKSLDFARQISRIFEMKVSSFAVARTRFFSKTLKTQARFSPRRVFVFVNLRPKDLYIKVKKNTEGRHPKSMPGLLQKLPSKSCILPPEQ